MLARFLLVYIKPYMNTNDNQTESPPDSTKIPTVTFEQLKAKLAEVQEVRPTGWSNSSVTPYYTRSFGEQAKLIIDTLLSDRENDLQFDMRTHSISVGTWKAQFYQGWAWLRQKHPDPEVRAKYTEIFVNKLVQTTTTGPKVRLYIKEVNTKELLAAMKKVRSLNSTEQGLITWKERLNKWIEEPHKEGETLSLEKERLTNDDLDYIDSLLATTANYIMTERKSQRVVIVYLDVSAPPED